MARSSYSWQRRICMSVSAAILLVTAVFVQPVQAVAEGDGFLIYSQNFLQTSPYKRYNDTTGRWSSATDVSTDATYSLRFVRAAASPTDPGDILEVHSNSNGQYRVHHWNGVGWTQDWVDSGGGPSPNTLQPRFDIAFDNVGNAVMIYSTNQTATPEIAYRVFTGSTNTWSAKQTFNATNTTGNVRHLRVVNRPGTDEFAFAWNDTNFDLSAAYYDLSANTFSAEPAAALSTSLSVLAAQTEPPTKNFDVAIERTSGEVLVCWSEEAVADLICRTRGAGTAGSWAAANTTYTTFANEPMDMHLASNPASGSDQIAICGDDTSTINTAVWSGSAWGNHSALDTTIDTLDQINSNCAVEWLVSGAQARAVVTYDDTDAAGIDWAVFNGSTWTVQTDHTGAFSPASGNDKFHEIKVNPLALNEAVVLVVDINLDLAVKKLNFDGSSFTWTSIDNSGATHEAAINSHVGWAVTFIHYASVPAAALGVDIIDATATSVTSPSVTMTPVTSSSTCQTSTGTLGTSSQKLRTSNTTTTPGWTLSVAASGGAAANWSASTDTYDFNDASGTGCTDGADSDGLAGQLSIDPSAATNTVDATCTSTGVSVGSSSAFAEGVTDNVTLLSASGSANTNCLWDLTDVSLSQKIPADRLPGSYGLQLTLTVTAN